VSVASTCLHLAACCNCQGPVAANVVVACHRSDQQQRRRRRPLGSLQQQTVRSAAELQGWGLVLCVRVLSIGCLALQPGSFC
jgi:hypothetical protein